MLLKTLFLLPLVAVSLHAAPPQTSRVKRLRQLRAACHDRSHRAYRTDRANRSFAQCPWTNRSDRRHRSQRSDRRYGNHRDGGSDRRCRSHRRYGCHGSHGGDGGHGTHRARRGDGGHRSCRSDGCKWKYRGGRDRPHGTNFSSLRLWMVDRLSYRYFRTVSYCSA